MKRALQALLRFIRDMFEPVLPRVRAAAREAVEDTVDAGLERAERELDEFTHELREGGADGSEKE